MGKHRNIFLLICLGILFWTFNLILHPDYIQTPDSAIYGDVARHIVTTGREVTVTTFPQHLIYFSKTENPTEFISQYPPFHPFVLSLFFRVFGIGNPSIAIENLFFYLATIPFVFYLGKKIFSEKAGIVASVFFISNPNILNLAVSGMSEPLFIFLVTSLFCSWLFLPIKFRFLEGVLLGLSLMTRFQGGIIIIAYFFACLFIKEQKVKTLLLSFSGFVVAILVMEIAFPGNLSRYLEISFYHSQASLEVGASSDLSISRSIALINFDPLTKDLGPFIRKIVNNSYLSIKEMFYFTVPTLVILFVLSIFFKHKGKAKELKILLIMSIIITLISGIIGIFDYRFISVFIPLISLFSAALLLNLIEKYSHLALFIIFFLIAPSFTYNASATNFIKVLDGSFSLPSVHRLVPEITDKNISDFGTVASDEATFITWYTGRSTVALPNSNDELKSLDSNILSIDNLVITNHPIGKSQGSFWDELVRSPRDFGKYKLTGIFELPEKSNYYNVPLKVVIFHKE